MRRSGRPKGTTGQARVLGDEEVEKLLISLFRSPKRNGKRNMAIVVISFRLGLRAKELASLKIKDVYDGNKCKKTLRLIAEYTKGNKHRDLPLNNELVIETLNTYIETRKGYDGRTFNIEAPLFRSQKGSYFSPNAMVRVLKNIYTEAGLEDASSHSGRRSLLTKLANKGVSAFYIRDIAGHSSVVTTQRYIDQNPTVIADILKQL
mgnify:CR=1 FL=1